MRDDLSGRLLKSWKKAGQSKRRDRLNSIPVDSGEMNYRDSFNDVDMDAFAVRTTADGANPTAGIGPGSVFIP